MPDLLTSPADIVLLPDAGPLITLVYADALDLLFEPGWSVALVDIVLHEVTRSQASTQGARFQLCGSRPKGDLQQ